MGSHYLYLFLYFFRRCQLSFLDSSYSSSALLSPSSSKLVFHFSYLPYSSLWFFQDFNAMKDTADYNPSAIICMFFFLHICSFGKKKRNMKDKKNLRMRFVIVYFGSADVSCLTLVLNSGCHIVHTENRTGFRHK
jgi:hypothetical protein